MEYVVLLYEQGLYGLGEEYNEDFMRVTYILENLEFEELLEPDEYEIVGYLTLR